MRPATLGAAGRALSALRRPVWSSRTGRGVATASGGAPVEPGKHAGPRDAPRGRRVDPRDPARCGEVPDARPSRARRREGERPVGRSAASADGDATGAVRASAPPDDVDADVPAESVLGSSALTPGTPASALAWGPAALQRPSGRRRKTRSSSFSCHPTRRCHSRNSSARRTAVGGAILHG